MTRSSGSASPVSCGPGRRGLPDRITVSERAGSLRGYLGEVFGETVDFSLGLGTARANRKPVLQVFDARGRSIAFVKIGGTEVTEALVRAEAESLKQLAEASLPRVLEVPRLLHIGSWEGASVLAMTALETSFLQRPKRQFDLPFDEMVQFHAAFAQGDHPLVESTLWRQMVAAQESLGRPTYASGSATPSTTSVGPPRDARCLSAPGTVTGRRGT